MASFAHGFSSWRRRRALSVDSQDTQDESSATQHTVSTARSPPRSVPNPHPNHNHSDGARPSPTTAVSSSYREPIRSFIHGHVRDHLAHPVDSVQSVRSVRQDTADLANYFLSDKKDGHPSFLARNRSQSPHVGPLPAGSDSTALSHDAESSTKRPATTIPEVSEPPSPEDAEDGQPAGGPSIIGRMLRHAPHTGDKHQAAPKVDQVHEDLVIDESDPGSSPAADESTPRASTETAPLLARWPSREAHHDYGMANGGRRDYDIEGQKDSGAKAWFGRWFTPNQQGKGQLHSVTRVVSDLKIDPGSLWQNVVMNPVSYLPAVIVGVLLNILDALSYGMILFPLGSPIFESLGSAGISIFYVSTIISQLTYSLGSVFRGGIGSELIEVVPFFHSMAATITDIVGEEDPEAVIATTITSYALSSMLTGAVFYAMGRFKFGYIVGFIPRHILIGCIGGVGWFLVATGFEVTARMDGSLNYDLDTLDRLIRTDTIPLWMIPLILAILLFYGQQKIDSKYFLPLYVCTVPLIFYFFVFSLDALDTDTLRDAGWIFNGPPAGEPWWYFWTLYQFDKVHWGAIIECIPAMLALTFFGILHVPINVPALALQTGEDHVDLDKELRLHGYSNFLSGAAGSIQNYLVFANTVLFMRSGGNSRVAGVMVAGLTFLVMTIGPSLIGFIPVMMVGVLIFDLGFELLIEAFWAPRKKLKWLEIVTVTVIVLVMGIYDFVVGIGVGILLAFVSLIVQTSRISPVRSSFSGEAVGSTVRRNPWQQHYLLEVGQQIHILKLAGFLFFGTIVSVEREIRGLITDEQFEKRPIRYLIIDLWQVTGLDYSAGEAFNTISRLLNKRGISLVLSGLDPDSPLGQSLRAVGLGDNVEVMMLPDLNSALESCENELLKTFYAGQEAAGIIMAKSPTTATSLEVPGSAGLHQRHGRQQQGEHEDQNPYPFDVLASSPRRSHLQLAASRSIAQIERARMSRWQSFTEPLRLLLQIFHGMSDQNEDFWFRATSYFVRREYPAGTTLFYRGDSPDGFYLLEKGILRAEYDLAQGRLLEAIVAGTTCGELPFFSETPRTATVVVERDCVLWLMDRDGWARLQKDEPAVASELLRMALKLTSERLSSITSYTLTVAT